MEPTTLTTLAGSLMSLFGLLVSLFSIHLGNWLSKLQALKTKWDINNGSDPKEVALRRECRYGFIELYNWRPFVMTGIIAGFGLAVLYFFNDVRTARNVVFPSIFVALYFGFFIIMIALQLVLLVTGWRVGETMKAELHKAYPPRPKP